MTGSTASNNIFSGGKAEDCSLSGPGQQARMQTILKLISCRPVAVVLSPLDYNAEASSGVPVSISCLKRFKSSSSCC